MRSRSIVGAGESSPRTALLELLRESLRSQAVIAVVLKNITARSTSRGADCCNASRPPPPTCSRSIQPLDVRFAGCVCDTLAQYRRPARVTSELARNLARPPAERPTAMLQNATGVAPDADMTQ